MVDRPGRMAAVSPLPATDVADREPVVPKQDYIDLGPVVAILVRYWIVIVAVTLIGGGIAFFRAIASPRTYEANTILVVGASKLADTGPPGGVPTTGNFRPIVANRSVAQKVVTKFHLDGPPYNYTASTFLEEAVQIDEIRSTSLFRLAVRLPDPQLAADVANALADGAVAYADDLSRREMVRARDVIKQELETARERLNQSATALSAFQRSAQVELARADVAALLDERQSLLKLSVEIAALKSRVAEEVSERDQRARVDVTTRTVVDDPALSETARRSGAADPSRLQMKSESVNEVYSDIDKNIAADKSQLAELEQRRQQLIDDRHLNAADIAKVRELYAKEAELSRLDTEHTLALRTYQDAATRYDGARLQVASRSAELQVLDPATPPSRALSRQVVNRTITATLISLSIAVGCVLAFGFGRRLRINS